MALINKFTGIPVSEETLSVLDRLNNGEDVPLQEITDHSGRTEKSVREPGGIQKAHVGKPILNKNVQKENPDAGFSFLEARDNYELFTAAHAEKLNRKKMQSMHTTVVINAFGGPGAGKSTASLGIAEELKKLGYIAEYVPEYSKELVWDEDWQMLDGSAEHQFAILEEQMRRMDRLAGKVDFIVTDAPILLNRVYNKELTPNYDKMLRELYNQYDNFNFVVQRDTKAFEKEGRIHDLQESLQKDKEIRRMLDQYGLYYGVYNHSSVNKVISNAVKTHQQTCARQEPVYLKIPHMSSRQEFRELIERLKSQGAKYDRQEKRWYITKETDSKPFSSFLPGPQKQSVLSKLNQNRNELENSKLSNGCGKETQGMIEERGRE